MFIKLNKRSWVQDFRLVLNVRLMVQAALLLQTTISSFVEIACLCSASVRVCGTQSTLYDSIVLT
jgi:hypothetical protein